VIHVLLVQETFQGALVYGSPAPQGRIDGVLVVADTAVVGGTVECQQGDDRRSDTGEVGGEAWSRGSGGCRYLASRAASLALPSASSAPSTRSAGRGKLVGDDTRAVKIRTSKYILF
jgi:hypothetical protein